MLVEKPKLRPAEVIMDPDFVILVISTKVMVSFILFSGKSMKLKLK